MNRKTNKQRVIEGLEEIIEPLKRGEYSFDYKDCPLCKLYRKETIPIPQHSANILLKCTGCPFALPQGTAGCISWKRELGSIIESVKYGDSPISEEGFQRIIAFILEWVKEELRILDPPEQFTRKHWRYIDWLSISEDWRADLSDAIKSEKRKESKNE